MIGVLFPNEFLVSVNNSCPIWKPKKLLGATGLITRQLLDMVSALQFCFQTFKEKLAHFCVFFCNRSLPFMVQCTY